MKIRSNEVVQSIPVSPCRSSLFSHRTWGGWMTFGPSHTNHSHPLEDIEEIPTALFVLVLVLSTFATCTSLLATPDYEKYTAFV